jgi:hypothetical protein
VPRYMVNKFGAQMLHILIKVTRANFFANSNNTKVKIDSKA